MQLKDVYPPPQRLTPDRQERMRVVLLDAIQPATSPARPRTSRRRWQVAVAGATVVSVGALAWVFLGPGGTTAAAAWAPVPEQVTGQAAARLASSCEARVARGNGPVRLGTVAAALTEQRGASSAVLLLGTGREGICIDPHAGAGSTGGIIGPLVGATVQDPVPGGLTVDGTPGGPGLGLWAVYGRVASTRAATPGAGDDSPAAAPSPNTGPGFGAVH